MVSESACVSQTANARAMEAICPQWEDVQRAAIPRPPTSTHVHSASLLLDDAARTHAPAPAPAPSPSPSTYRAIPSTPTRSGSHTTPRYAPRLSAMGIPAPSPSHLALASPLTPTRGDTTTPSMNYPIRKVRPSPPRLHSHRTTHRTHARQAPSRPCRRPGSTLRCARNHHMWEPCRLSLRLCQSLRP